MIPPLKNPGYAPDSLFKKKQKHFYHHPRKMNDFSIIEYFSKVNIKFYVQAGLNALFIKFK